MRKGRVDAEKNKLKQMNQKAREKMLKSKGGK